MMPVTPLGPPDASPGGGPTGLGYRGLAGGRDEAVDADGRPRAHWEPFVRSLGELGWGEVTRRWEESRQVIRENGMTYNVYGDPRGLDRPWQLDPIPLLISPADVKALEAGLTQRARLFDALLADLYGPQRSLREGVLPPELVFGDRRFLRACHNVAVPRGRYLHLYAADLGRGADGSFYVLGDRTQAPSGAGYALENRIVLSRMLPETFGESRVHRLAVFFRTLRDTLRSLAPRNRDNPRIVLLTPGPYNETYFEHAYLARYLGFTLVEGGDLTVRDARVYLKLLGGLLPVDVILRRLDDDYCDPLELRGDSFLGASGLMQAVRAGNVAMANALGTGLVEAPAFIPYLPGLCRLLLGEHLNLASTPTWWCGDPAALGHVLQHLDKMVVKSSRLKDRFRPAFVAQLAAADRAKLIDRIRAKPVDFVAQERLPLSTVPVLANDRLEPRHVVLRAFLAANDHGFAVMPGGLSRVTASAEMLDVSMQEGGGSKDTWVLSDRPVSTFTLLNNVSRPVELSRGGNDLPSRAADNLFWLGRYVERAEGLVRLLRVVLVRLTESGGGAADTPELLALIRAVGRAVTPLPMAEVRPPDLEDRVREILFDEHAADSLVSTVRAVHRIARTVRDRLSNDMWRVLGGLTFPGDALEEPDPRVYRNGSPPRGRAGWPGTLNDLLDDMNRLVGGLAAFGGLAGESMSRGQAWRFLDIGRRLERAVHLIDLVRGCLVEVGPNEGPLLEALLEIADSSMTYRRRYLSSVTAGPVLDLLLADESNPRSVVFQVVALADAVNNLPQLTARAGRSPEQKLVLGVVSCLQLADIPAAVVPTEGLRPQLGELLARLAHDLPKLTEALTQTYLTHLTPSRHLSGGRREGRP